MDNSTILPAQPRSQNLAQYEPPSMAAPIQQDLDLAIEEAEGIYVYDTAGRRYIDLTGGSGVANIGYSHPALVASVQAQAARVMCTGWKIASSLRAEVAQRLLSLLPPTFEKVLFSVTGSEAVEGALKIARAATGRGTVLAFTGAYHGKTLGSLEMTSRAAFKTGVTQLNPNGLRLPFPNCGGCFFGRSYPGCATQCFDLIDHLLSDPAYDLTDIAAIILEPIQGAEGIVLPPKEFVQKLRAFCTRHGILLIFDEIFTGFGRTGKWFCFEHYDVVPDLLVAGKALGGGLPLSVTVGSSAVMDRLGPYKQTSTFSANALALSAALTVMDILKSEDLPGSAARRGAQLMRGLEALKGRYGFIREVRGLGLMIGVELSAERLAEPAKKFAQEALRRGLILLSGGKGNTVLKLTPPLMIDEAQVEEVLTLADEVFGAMAMQYGL